MRPRRPKLARPKLAIRRGVSEPTGGAGGRSPVGPRLTVARTKHILIFILVAMGLWSGGSLAQVGFGGHPLGMVTDRSFGFSLSGGGTSEDVRHLQVLPRSIRPGGGWEDRGGYGFNDSSTLELYSRGQLSLEEALKRLARESAGSLFGIRAHEPESNGSILLSFHVGGIGLCFFGIRGAAVLGREIMLQGQVPVVTNWTTPTSLEDWPDLEQSAIHAVDSLERTMGGPVELTGESSRCFATARGSLKPAWHMTMVVGGYRYAVYTDSDQIWAVEPEFFHASGRARVYPYDPMSTPALATETLSDLTGDGTLATEYFRTMVSAGQAQASSSRLEYLYDEGTKEFDETSAFVNVTKHFKFLQGLGFSWYGPRPLVVHPNLGTIPNNARFLPPRGTGSLPTIEIGPGAEGVLRNLATDAGVVSHELGHFAIYRAVTKTSGESFVLHEGLADFFEAARAEDPCLGNSVCPLESGVCMVRGKCLRTAGNSFRYQDDSWQGFLSPGGQYTHLHGQVFSGLLWDLRKKAKGGAKSVDTLVMRAIGFLPPEAGFSDFLTQLVATDKEIHQGADRDQILQVVADRDLSSFLKLDGRGNPIVAVEKDNGQTATDTRPTAGETRRRTQKSKGCGVVAMPRGPGDGERPMETLFFMIIAPLLLIFLYNKSFFIKNN